MNDQALVTSNSQAMNSSEVVVERFPYNLCYEKTEWGLFYESHKGQSQQALSKRILKMEKEKAKLITKWKCRYERPKVVQGIFKNTEWDERRTQFVLPTILKMEKADVHRNNTAWCDIKTKQLTVVGVVYQKYFSRMASELDEVKLYFELRQQELKLEQTNHHKNHASETITCPICSTCISRTNLARHTRQHS